MIRPSYAIKLAVTKFKFKPWRIFSSILIAGTMFGLLIGVVVVSSSAQKSADRFVRAVGNGQYLVKVTPNVPSEEIYEYGRLSSERIKEIRQIEKEYYSALELKYKNAGATYDKSVEVPVFIPNPWALANVPEDERVSFNHFSPVYRKIINDKNDAYIKKATNKTSDIRKLGKKYNATGFYSEPYFGVEPLPVTRLIENNQEDFGVDEQKIGDPYLNSSLSFAAYNSTYKINDEALLDRYLTKKDFNNPNAVPVIITASEAVRMFGEEEGIGKEPKDPKQKLDWYNSIQKKLTGKTYQACYRNPTEQNMLTKIQDDYIDIKTNSKKEGYVEPALQYSKPETACGDILIKKDTRSVAEKDAEKKRIETEKKLGFGTNPYHKLITFEVVGFINSVNPVFNIDSAESYIKNLLIKTSLDTNAIIPKHMYEKTSLKKELDEISQQNASLAYTQNNYELAPLILEFNSAEEAKTFIKKETCGANEECNKPYRADTYGSNFLAIDDFSKASEKIVSIVTLAVAVIAIFVVIFVVQKVMSENRKETAIYRAMGAKRLDIFAIYGTYTLMITLMILMVALAVGMLVAYILDLFYTPLLNDIALASYGVPSNDAYINLASFNFMEIIKLSIFVVLVCATASFVPLILNTLRSPVKDMREE